MITVYAPNFEDVHLWRALGHVERGRYIDVCALDPDESATRLFYERSWRGVDVVPFPPLVARLTARRPGDVVVGAACAAHEGDGTLYEVVGTDRSTLDADRAEEIAERGETVITHPIPLVTLESVVEEHCDDLVHLLVVEADWAVPGVLAGADLSRWRPWVLVLATPAPASGEADDPVWEPLVIGARYEKVLYDGHNTYYLAEEHADLAAAFEIPPTALDDFALASGHRHVDQDEVAGLRRDVASLSLALDRSQASVSRYEELARSTEEWARSTEAQLKLSEEQATTAQARAAQAEQVMNGMRRSLSWAVTAPLRVVPVAMRASRRVAAPKVKNAARPVLATGLRMVRSNKALHRLATAVVAKLPSAGPRLRAFASARPADEETR